MFRFERMVDVNCETCGRVYSEYAIYIEFGDASEGTPRPKVCISCDQAAEEVCPFVPTGKRP